MIKYAGNENLRFEDIDYVLINALIAVLGAIIGEMIWGIPGMFLSIPVIAMLKIIFDRIDSLKSWGIILGDEEPNQNRLAETLKVKKKTASS